MDWKQSFDGSILNQGWKIYEAGLVSHLMHDNDIFQAMVMDPWLHRMVQVKAQIDDGEVVFLECGCPYGSSERLCAHEAAFLFALENCGSLDEIPSVSRSGRVYPEQKQNNTLYRTGSVPESEQKISPVDRKPLWDDPRERSFRQEKNRDQMDHAGVHTSDSPQLSGSDRILEKQPLKNEELSELFRKFNANLERQKTGAAHADPRAEETAAQSEDEFETQKQTSDLSDLPHQKETEFHTAQKSANHQDEEVHSAVSEQPDVPSAGCGTKQKPGSSGCLNTLIETMDAEKLRDFVRKQAMTNPEFRQKLELELMERVPEDLLDSWYSGLDGLIFGAQDEYGCIPARKAESFTDSFISFLKTRAFLLADHQHMSEALQLIRYAVESLLSVLLSHPDQDRRIWEEINEIIRTVSESLDLEQKRDLFAWLELLSGKVGLRPDAAENIEELIAELFKEEEFAGAEYELMRRFYQREADEFGQGYDRTPAGESRLLDLADLLENHEILSAQKEQFLQEFGSHPAIQRRKIERAMQNGDFAEATRLIENLLSQTPEESESYADALRNLSRIQEEMDQKAGAAALLRQLIVYNGRFHAEDLLRLRNLIDADEWDQVLDQAALKGSPFELAEVYEKTSQTDRLMNLVEKHPSSYLIETCESSLIQKYPARLARLYCDQAENQAAIRNRKNEEHVIYHLNRAAALPEGSEMAAQTAELLRKKYPHRRRLTSMLEEAGF